MKISLKVIVAVMVLLPVISGRVLRGWPAAVDDFQDAPEEPAEETQLKQEVKYGPPKEIFGEEEHEYEDAAASNNQGYFQGFAPKSIVLDDNLSIESRFAFPDFPKIDFPFDGPFGGEVQQ